MDLKNQLQALIDEAPPDGKTPQAMVVIAPVLEQVAQQLSHPQYYILQNMERRWQLTTLQNQNQPKLEKTVVYAFAQLQDATRSAGDQNLMALPMPVIQLLFQLLAMQPVDSLIFLDTPGDLNAGVEVLRQDLQQVVQLQLQQYLAGPLSDIA